MYIRRYCQKNVNIVSKKTLGYGKELKRRTHSRKLQNTKKTFFKSIRQYDIIHSYTKYEGIC